MANFENEIYMSTILQLARTSDPVGGNETYDLAGMFGGHMDEETLAAMERDLLEGNMLYFDYGGKDDALDMLYDLFEIGVFEYPCLAFLYPIGVDEEPIEAVSPDEVSREEMHELMDSGRLGMCLLTGCAGDGTMLPFAVMWSSYEDSTPESLILANSDRAPYPELGWLLAFLLNTGLR